MRRFDILKHLQDDFKCIEILEDVENFTGSDIVRLNNFNAAVCGADLNRF